MIPVNQVILGGDPLLGSSIANSNLDSQLQMLEKYKHNLEMAKQMQNQQSVENNLIWDEIDTEVAPLTDEQKAKLLNNEEYVETYNKIQSMVNSEILNLVKSKIESTPEGKELLAHQLKLVKKLKGKIIDETNIEMELFRKFKNYSSQHPEITYDEFIKNNL